MLLLLLLCILLAYWLQGLLYRKYWNRNLIVRAEFADSYVYEGDTSRLREEIVNDKLLPLPALELQLALSRNLVFSGEAQANSSVTDQTYKHDIFSFLFHQKVVHSLPFQCRRRGFYQLTNLEVAGYDLFFRPGYYMDVPQQTQLYVYPAQADIRRIRLLCQAISGMVLVQNRLFPDPFAFAGIRDYTPTDPMNHINWKASARNSKLMVNQFDSTTSIQTTVILDVEDPDDQRYAYLTEEGIRIVSSLAARMSADGTELRLVSNALCTVPGTEDTEALAWFLKAGCGHIQELNRMLACIDTRKCSCPLRELLDGEATRRRSGQIYVLISRLQSADTMQLLYTLAANGNEILWVLPLHPSTELTLREAPGIHLMRWEATP